MSFNDIDYTDGYTGYQKADMIPTGDEVKISIEDILDREMVDFI